MTCLLVNTSGIVRGNLWRSEPQIWLVQITRCHMDWYCQKADALLSLSGTLPTVLWIDIVKGQFIALLDP